MSSEAVPGPGPEGNGLFERANREYDAGNFEKALELLDQVIDAGQGSEVVYNNKGATLDALQRYDESSECYKKAIHINPGYELAWHNLGNSYLMREMFQRAASAYSRASALNPDRKENWTGLAAAQTKLEKKRAAKAAIRKLSGFVETDPSVLLAQADLYLEAGLQDEAIKACEEYIKRRPGDARGYSTLGSIEHEVGVYGRAIATFEKALELAPDDKESWNNLGYTCFVAGYFNRALECFDKAISIDPRYKPAWYNKGYAYHGADLLEEAVGCYRRAIAIDPFDRVLWNNLGNALYNLGRYAESIPKFVEALYVDPDYEIAWNNIGNALEKMSSYEAAIPYHDRSLEIDPSFDYALYAKGVCGSMMGSLEEGFDLVVQSIEMNPDYDEAWLAKSRIAAWMGRYDEAVVAIDEGIAVNPEFDQGWTHRGDLMLAVGRREEAQVCYETALSCLETVRGDTVGGMAAIIRRGELQARLGRFDEALLNFESIALVGKMEFLCVPRLLEVRRFLGRYELPEALREAVEHSSDHRARLAYAEFLMDVGQPERIEAVLSDVTDAECSGRRTSLLARAKASAGDVDGALVILDVSDIDREGHGFWKTKGEIYEAAGNLPAALRAHAKARSIVPSDYSVSVALARILVRQGMHKKALKLADEAIGLDPREWEPHKIKADAYHALGQAEDVERELEDARTRLFAAGLRPDDAW